MRSSFFRVGYPLLFRAGWVLVLSCSLSACAFFSTHQEPKKKPSKQEKKKSKNQKDKSAESIPSPYRKRIQKLEKKIEVLNTKLNSTQQSLKQLEHQKSKKEKNNDKASEGVQPHPADAKGTSSEQSDTPKSSSDSKPASALMDRYRDAIVFFKGESYADAILKFSQFVKKYPDHFLASSAKYYIGESYFHQKQYKKAKKTFTEALEKWPKNNHIPKIIRRLAKIEEQLKNSSEAAKYRQLLLSLFPQSPAAIDSLELKQNGNQKNEEQP